ncbi:MAG: S-layer homology domain-containing protein [Leptolyngbya sp. IPPAS B-1204]
MKKERFLSALSLTLLLTSLSAVAQVQQSVDPIAEVTAAGWMSAYPDGKFHGDVVLSRAELASILVKAFQLDRRQALAEPIQLQDVPKTHWAYNDIQTVLRNGIMTGYREGRFSRSSGLREQKRFPSLLRPTASFSFLKTLSAKFYRPIPMRLKFLFGPENQWQRRFMKGLSTFRLTSKLHLLLR